MNDAPLPPAGWYPDPEGGAGTRYWNGATWTAHTAEAPATAQPGYPAAPTYGATPAYGAMPTSAGGSQTQGLWIGGVVCGVVALLCCQLVGVVGLGLGIVAVRKGDKLGWIAVGLNALALVILMVIVVVYGARGFSEGFDSY